MGGTNDLVRNHIQGGSFDKAFSIGLQKNICGENYLDLEGQLIR
jgi:hypothetical protein